MTDLSNTYVITEEQMRACPFMDLVRAVQANLNKGMLIQYGIDNPPVMLFKEQRASDPSAVRFTLRTKKCTSHYTNDGEAISQFIINAM